jgi:menaquinone-9 beta-reductase
MTHFDLAVIGAGPAGSAAAITASRAGMKVLLLDQDTFPRNKVCGEFISAESLHLLGGLVGKDWGVPPPSSGDRVGISIKTVRLYRYGEVISSTLPNSGCSLPRFDLDAMLVQAASRSACVVTNSRVRRVERHGDMFHIVSDGNTFSAMHVINASGRWSEFSEKPPVGAERWIGIKQHMNERHPPHSTDLYFFKGGYCGVQPVSDNAVNACALVKASAATTMQKVISLSTALVERASAWTPVGAGIVTAPVFFTPPVAVRNGILNVGDSAAFIDPFLGDGISIALQTGVLAAHCLQRPRPYALYAREYARRVTPALRRAKLLRRLSHSNLAWTAMRLPGALSVTARLTRVRAA